MTAPVGTPVPAGPSPLDRGRLRARLAAGEATLGTFLGAASPVCAEVCAAAGPDWLLLDLEHGSGGEEQVRDVVPAAGAYGVPTVVRVESGARIRIGRVMDLGAAGVMLPRMDSADEVREAVRHLRYPPDGDRGVALHGEAKRREGADPGTERQLFRGVLPTPSGRPFSRPLRQSRGAYRAFSEGHGEHPVQRHRARPGFHGRSRQ